MGLVFDGINSIHRMPFNVALIPQHSRATGGPPATRRAGTTTIPERDRAHVRLIHLGSLRD
jgi:hypothetical protein